MTGSKQTHSKWVLCYINEGLYKFCVCVEWHRRKQLFISCQTKSVWQSQFSFDVCLKVSGIRAPVGCDQPCAWYLTTEKQSCVQDWFVFTEAGPPHRQAIFMLSVHHWYYRMCCLWWGFVGLQTLETWLCDTSSCLFVGLLHPENIHECNFCCRNSCMYDVPCFTCYIWGYMALSSGFGVCCAMSTWRLEA